ncbi:MAG TPA: maltotransferase domain-containing protein, partial [Bryobacteraceae bacterium]|nr:maltotransferase domain-containing protein [Bryobacteraceae bacterium]
MAGRSVEHATAERAQPQTEGRDRAAVERVRPEIDSGRFPIKRIVNDIVTVEADVFADGHGRVFCQLLYREHGEEWSRAPMEPLGNDRWRGEFLVSSLGRYEYTVEGWTDPRFVTRYGTNLGVTVDRPKARFSSWYEVFPRSSSPEPGRHGT